MGKLLLVLGLVIALVGLLMMFGDRIPFLGKLPGDIVIRRKNLSFYFPLGTCILTRSYKEARKRGTVRLEGKTYPVKDGDVIEFRFNV